MDLLAWGRKQTKRGKELREENDSDEEKSMSSDRWSMKEKKWRGWNKTKGKDERKWKKWEECDVKRKWRWEHHLCQRCQIQLRAKRIRAEKNRMDEINNKIGVPSCLETEWLVYHNGNQVDNTVTKAPLPWQRTKWCCCFLLLQNINQQGRDRERERDTDFDRETVLQRYINIWSSFWVAGLLADFTSQLPTSKKESVRQRQRGRERNLIMQGQWAEKKKSHHANKTFK